MSLGKSVLKTKRDMKRNIKKLSLRQAKALVFLIDNPRRWYTVGEISTGADIRMTSPSALGRHRITFDTLESLRGAGLVEIEDEREVDKRIKRRRAGAVVYKYRTGLTYRDIRYRIIGNPEIENKARALVLIAKMEGK